ncbi:MAG: DUF5678 domain-containing protein [Caldilineaceae bacterium]
MIAIELQETALAEEVNRVATHESKEAKDVLAEAVRQYLDAYREQRIHVEAQAWYAMSSATRSQYQGRFVAVYNGEIVDSDPNQRTLYLRTKEQYGREPVLLVEGGDQPMPVYQSYSAYAA